MTIPDNDVATVAALIMIMAGVWAIVAILGSDWISRSLSNEDGELPKLLQKLREEPALVRAGIVQAVAILAMLGFELSPEGIVVLETLVVGIIGIWIRAGVSSTASLERQGFTWDGKVHVWRNAEDRFGGH